MEYYEKEKFSNHFGVSKHPQYQMMKPKKSIHFSYNRTTFPHQFLIFGSTLIFPMLSSTRSTSSAFFPVLFNPWHSSHLFSSSTLHAYKSFDIFAPGTSSSCKTILSAIIYLISTCSNTRSQGNNIK